MENPNTYITILIQSLSKKKQLLDGIFTITMQQEQILKASPQDSDAFEKTLVDKETLLNALNEIDDGFETVYARVKEELDVRRDKYQSEIEQLQVLIREVTDIGVKVQALERQNHTMVENHLTSRKKEIRTLKKSNQTANQYYQNMVDRNSGESYFLDKKK